jgi:peptidoglycan/xylan/chitin deacetylase (PgdA/CDA1 family)
MADAEPGHGLDRTLAILSYHKIGGPSPGAWQTWYYVSEEAFAVQLRQVGELGWQIIDVSTFLEGLQRPSTLPPRAALITFDDGYRSVLQCALPIMAELGCPGVIFVPTDYIGDISRFDENTAEPPEPICGLDELSELEAGAVSVQSHGVSHRPFSELSAQEIEHELVNSKSVLEQGLGKTVELFAFAQGDAGVEPSAVSGALWRSGYRAACLFLGGPVRLPAEDPYRLTRIPMWPDTDVAAELP